MTLINTFLVGGIILLFGTIVFQLISLTLTYQIDRQLRDEATQVIGMLPLVDSGEFGVELVNNVKWEEGYYFQFWSRDNRLLRKSANLDKISPLDVSGFGLAAPTYSRTDRDGIPMRVLSVPLQVGQRPVGTLIVGADLFLIDLIQRYILTVLVWGVIIAVIMVGLGVWLSTYRALEPLEEVSETAIQISQADDLSQRIPYRGPRDDEVGQLIQVFNQTLEQLEDLFNSQRQFISDVSHELRTPLTVIKGNLDLLKEIECIDDETFEIVSGEVGRLTRMVNDILVLAQAESGQLPLNRESVALDTLLLEVFQHARTLSQEKVKLEIAELDQVIAIGDPDRLKQVMLNLVSNAIKYTPAGGQVTLRLKKDQNIGYFSVSDTGPGISEEDLPHIFKRFYRAEKARTRSRDSGYGLGLSIAYWIIEKHEGTIEVESTKGEGTVFTVKLPLGEREEETQTWEN